MAVIVPISHTHTTPHGVHTYDLLVSPPHIDLRAVATTQIKTDSQITVIINLLKFVVLSSLRSCLLLQFQCASVYHVVAYQLHKYINQSATITRTTTEVPATVGALYHSRQVLFMYNQHQHQQQYVQQQYHSLLCRVLQLPPPPIACPTCPATPVHHQTVAAALLKQYPTVYCILTMLIPLLPTSK